MSSKKSDQTLILDPVGSRYLAFMLLFLYGAAMLVTVHLPLPVWAVATLALFLIFNLHHAFNHHVLGRYPDSILQLTWDGDGEWRLLDGRGCLHEARLLPDSYVHPLLVILNFRYADGRRQTMLMMPDSLPRKLWKQLLVRLRMEDPD